MKLFDRNYLKIAVKDAFFKNSYDPIGIEGGYVVVRNDEVDDWTEEGITVIDGEGDISATYFVGQFAETEGAWEMNKGLVIDEMVSQLYNEYQRINRADATDEVVKKLEDTIRDKVPFLDYSAVIDLGVGMIVVKMVGLDGEIIIIQYEDNTQEMIFIGGVSSLDYSVMEFCSYMKVANADGTFDFVWNSEPKKEDFEK